MEDKIFTTEPKGSTRVPIHFEGEKRIGIFNCEVHGIKEIEETYVMWAKAWMPGLYCNICNEEKEKLRKKKDEEERQRYELEAAFSRTLIPQRFKGKDFENFDSICEKSTLAKNICKSYAEKFQELHKLGTGLILCGNTGTGKTHLACSVIDYIIRNVEVPYKTNGKMILKKSSAIFMETAKIIRQVKQTYSKSSSKTEQQVIDSFVLPDLLVMDEVGVQFGSDTEKMIIFEIINERYLHIKPTILISNLSLKELADYIGDRVIDRMRENGGKVVVFDWKTHRGN